MDGELGRYIRSAIEKVGIHAFPKMLDNGFRQVTSSIKPIRSAADLTGLRIRVPVSAVQLSLFEPGGGSRARGWTPSSCRAGCHNHLFPPI
jgi:TRAP-type C4-dicarboxylate transport system substrate-binding protein